MNPAKRPCLPLFKSMAEAVALSKNEQDNFYIAVLHIQRWLAQANKEAVAEYAEKKNPRDRSLQTGSAWRLFRQHFAELPDPEFSWLFTCMARLTTYDDPISRCLSEARHALQIEHDCTGDFFGPKTAPFLIGNPQSAIELLRNTAKRWCDWLDASNHLHVHRNWHHTPIYFDRDLEKRGLASLGLTQRNYAELNDWMKGAWQHLHGRLAQRYKQSAKWLMVGQALASQEKRLWTYHQVDTLIIYLWPLLKLHNWTYCDLMNVVRSLRTDLSCRSNETKEDLSRTAFSAFSPQPLAFSTYPCNTDRDFANYCLTILGLRKTRRGKTTKDGKPPGFEVAHRLFPPSM
jgi:hypothetical protein